jgi:hypothetical protein
MLMSSGLPRRAIVVLGHSLASSLRRYPATPLADTPAADVAIVLGGAVGQPLPATSQSAAQRAPKAMESNRCWLFGQSRSRPCKHNLPSGDHGLGRRGVGTAV